MEGLASCLEVNIRGFGMFDERCSIEGLELRQDFVKVFNEVLVVADWVPKAKRVYTPATRAWRADYRRRLALGLPDDSSP